MKQSSVAVVCFLSGRVKDFKHPRTILQQVYCHTSYSDSKVRELIAVKVLHTSLLNTTVVAFKVLPFGSYAPMPAPSKQFWN